MADRNDLTTDNEANANQAADSAASAERAGQLEKARARRAAAAKQNKADREQDIAIRAESVQQRRDKRDEHLNALKEQRISDMYLSQIVNAEEPPAEPKLDDRTDYMKRIAEERAEQTKAKQQNQEELAAKQAKRLQDERADQIKRRQEHMEELIAKATGDAAPVLSGSAAPPAPPLPLNPIANGAKAYLAPSDSPRPPVRLTPIADAVKTYAEFPWIPTKFAAQQPAAEPLLTGSAVLPSPLIPATAVKEPIGAAKEYTESAAQQPLPLTPIAAGVRDYAKSAEKAKPSVAAASSNMKYKPVGDVLADEKDADKKNSQGMEGNIRPDPNYSTSDHENNARQQQAENKKFTDAQLKYLNDLVLKNYDKAWLSSTDPHEGVTFWRKPVPGLLENSCRAFSVTPAGIQMHGLQFPELAYSTRKGLSHRQKLALLRQNVRDRQRLREQALGDAVRCSLQMFGGHFDTTGSSPEFTAKVRVIARQELLDAHRKYNRTGKWTLKDCEGKEIRDITINGVSVTKAGPAPASMNPYKRPSNASRNAPGLQA